MRSSLDFTSLISLAWTRALLHSAESRWSRARPIRLHSALSWASTESKRKTRSRILYRLELRARRGKESQEVERSMWGRLLCFKFQRFGASIWPQKVGQKCCSAKGLSMETVREKTFQLQSWCGFKMLSVDSSLAPFGENCLTPNRVWRRRRRSTSTFQTPLSKEDDYFQNTMTKKVEKILMSHSYRDHANGLGVGLVEDKEGWAGKGCRELLDVGVLGLFTRFISNKRLWTKFALRFVWWWMLQHTWPSECTTTTIPVKVKVAQSSIFLPK